MEEAVTLATQRAHAGDAVLMSPACASFDMFQQLRASRRGVPRGGAGAGRRGRRAMLEGDAHERLSAQRLGLAARRPRQRSRRAAPARVHGLRPGAALGHGGAAGLGPGDGVFGLDRAARTTPSSRATPTPTSWRGTRCSWRCRFVAGAAGLPGAGGDLGAARRPGCSSLSLLLLVVVLIPHIGKGVNGARRWIVAGLHDASSPPSWPSSRCCSMPPTTWCARWTSRSASSAPCCRWPRPWPWSACCCWPSPTWAPSW